MEKDFLAVCLIGAGSSWGRCPDPERAIKNCTEALVSDWGSIYKLDGAEVMVNLFDVTGNDTVRWDVDGIHGDREEEFPIKRIEVRTVKLRDKRKRR